MGQRRLAPVFVSGAALEHAAGSRGSKVTSGCSNAMACTARNTCYLALYRKSLPGSGCDIFVNVNKRSLLEGVYLTTMKSWLSEHRSRIGGLPWVISRSHYHLRNRKTWLPITGSALPGELCIQIHWTSLIFYFPLGCAYMDTATVCLCLLLLCLCC